MTASSTTGRDAAQTRETFADRIARIVRDDIVMGRRLPGEALRQQEIADALGASRPPVREALRLLEAEGFVTLHPYSGARVARLDFQECVEIYKIRERIEPLAFSESMAWLLDDQLSVADAAATLVEAARGDVGLWLEADRNFHLACYAGLSSRRLSDMITGFWNSTQMYRRVLLMTFTEQDYTTAHDEHRLMLVALHEKNARAGEELLRFALERSRMRLTANRDLF